MRRFACGMMITVMVVLIVSTVLQDTVYASPLAEDGQLDLSAVDLNEAGPVNLRGNWHLYWKQFLQSNELEGTVPLLVKTSATWGSQGTSITDHGYGTYRLVIYLHEEDTRQTLGLLVPSIASAYELYINNERVATAGQIGESLEQMKPASGSKTIFFTVDSPVIELIVQVSNFAQRKGGIWDDFKLGTADQISKEREQRLVFQGSIATGWLLMSIFLLGFYIFRAEKSTLYFGIACLALFFRAIYVGDMLAVQFMPFVPWEIAVKIEYLSAFWGISLMVLYFYYLNEGSLRRRLSFSLVLIMVGTTLPVLVLPVRIYTEWLVLYQSIFLLMVAYIFYGLLRAVRQRHVGSIMNLVAGIIFLTTVIMDILYYTFQVNSNNLVMAGLFLFVVTQMLVLSRKYAIAFAEVERLNLNLEDVNNSLEDIVVKRTAALRDSNDRLESSERARKDLLSNITHELGNPLTSIIGYLQRLKDGVPEETRSRHIQIAYQKALRLEAVTEDLRQLVKLEQGQLSYTFQRIKLQLFYDELRAIYDWELLDRQIDFDLRLSDIKDVIVKIDLQRIEQVFTNIINNAIAHTKKGERIFVTGRYFVHSGAIAITVTDTGMGVRPEDRDQLFERFYRAQHVNKEGYDGTGLGLTISKAIVEAHGGKIGFRSKYGEGSSFYFILPEMRGTEDDACSYSDRG